MTLWVRINYINIGANFNNQMKILCLKAMYRRYILDLKKAVINVTAKFAKKKKNKKKKIIKK